MVWAIHPFTGEWREHFKYGLFTTTFKETHGNVSVPSDYVKGRISLSGTDIA